MCNVDLGYHKFLPCGCDLQAQDYIQGLFFSQVKITWVLFILFCNSVFQVYLLFIHSVPSPLLSTKALKGAFVVRERHRDSLHDTVM